MTTNGFDPMARYALLSERVENRGKDFVDLRSNMNTGFQPVNSSFNALSNELRNNSKTQWPVIWSVAGVCTAALVAAGTFDPDGMTHGARGRGSDQNRKDRPRSARQSGASPRA